MPKWTPEQAKARQRFVNQKAQIRALLMAGDVSGAEAVATKGGFDIFAARLAPVYKNVCEPFFVALEQTYAAGKDFAGGVQPVVSPVEVPAVTEPPAPIEPDATEVNGWPTRTPAVIWSFPPNKKLVVIQLPDKRRASMYRGRKTWAIHDKLTAKLVSAQADPIYEIAHVSRPSW